MESCGNRTAGQGGLTPGFFFPGPKKNPNLSNDSRKKYETYLETNKKYEKIICKQRGERSMHIHRGRPKFIRLPVELSQCLKKIASSPGTSAPGMTPWAVGFPPRKWTFLKTNERTRWWQLKYFLFSPVFGEDEPILTNIFQRG